MSGFTRPDVTVFDVSEPQRPVFVEAPVSRLADGTFA